ncbi:MAG: hypothetical protein R2754_01830 [Microthrixaceae bacterium]
MDGPAAITLNLTVSTPKDPLANDPEVSGTVDFWAEKPAEPNQPEGSSEFNSTKVRGTVSDGQLNLLRLPDQPKPQPYEPVLLAAPVTDLKLPQLSGLVDSESCTAFEVKRTR